MNSRSPWRRGIQGLGADPSKARQIAVVRTWAAGERGGWRCFFCRRGFANEPALTRHTLEQHSGEARR